jgi:hypothetical protein
MGPPQPELKYRVLKEFLATGLLGVTTAALVSGSRPDGLELWTHLLLGVL